MPSIRKRGQNNQARVRIDGKRIEKSFASLECAERWG